MLNEDEKQKIRLEEMYRAEVRKQLTDEPNPPSRFFVFLNSSFGLWLFSAIFVTGGSLWYTHHETAKDEERRTAEVAKKDDLKNSEVIDRLDLEIGYRFSQFQIRLASLVDWQSKKPSFQLRPGESYRDVEKIIDSLSTQPTGIDPPLYQEFSKLSTLASIAELRRHVPNSQQEQLDQVIADLSGIYIFLNVRKVRLIDVHTLANVIHDSLTLDRWQKGKFYFSDCPFC